MGVTKERAAENRRKILAAASQLFREKGVDAVGLTEIMKKAGFTQGGFYNHFTSKEALVAEVVGDAVDRGVDELAAAIATSLADGADPLTRQIGWYLSPGQRDNTQCGCPMAGFAGDVRRLTKEAQVSYANALRGTFDQLAETIRLQKPALSRDAAHSKAVAMYSQMAGALILSRAVSTGEPDLANDILRHARQNLLSGFAKPTKRAGKRLVSRQTRSRGSFDIG